MSDVYVVIDWDNEELVAVEGRLQGAVLAKAMYCDRIGIAQDDGFEEPRYRVVIVNGELNDPD